MAVLNSREKAQERARKHARNVWECPLCAKRCRGNGGRASHMRKHVTAAGYDRDHIFGWGLRVVFNSLWRDGPRPDGLPPPPGEFVPPTRLCNGGQRHIDCRLPATLVVTLTADVGKPNPLQWFTCDDHAEGNHTEPMLIWFRRRGLLQAAAPRAK